MYKYKNKILTLIFFALITLIGQYYGFSKPSEKAPIKDEKIKLPPPRYDSTTSVEKALLERRSIRDLKDDPLTINEISQLLWAAQGVTDSRGI